ncbi:hypothetical protein [Dysgonomonas termitidis]|uniref:Uncharacterized protein n=1 Tax=Dysgonomonas termitidis TaxID=1516126 RepID=A0ABV9KVT8_9BACT
MSENQLMDKLVAGYNDMCKELESLDSEIKESESEIDDLVKKIKDWQESYDNYSRIRKGAAYGTLQYEMADMAMKKLLPEIHKMQHHRDDLVKEHDNLVKEHDSLKEKLGNTPSLSAEKKVEAYYNSLCKQMNWSAKSEEEYTALANKFSDISGYKDCAALAEKCKERAKEVHYNLLVKEMQSAKYSSTYFVLANKFSAISGYKDCATLAEKCKRRAEEVRIIDELDKELNTKLKSLDNDIAELKAELKKEEDDSSWRVLCAGGVLGIILALIVKGGVGYAILGGVVGLIIGFIIAVIICAILDSKNKPKLQEFENKKSALRSEYEKKKEEIIKNYQS